jgi:hypothetical protein
MYKHPEIIRLLEELSPISYANLNKTFRVVIVRDNICNNGEMKCKNILSYKDLSLLINNSDLKTFITKNFEPHKNIHLCKVFERLLVYFITNRGDQVKKESYILLIDEYYDFLSTFNFTIIARLPKSKITELTFLRLKKYLDPV